MRTRRHGVLDRAKEDFGQFDAEIEQPIGAQLEAHPAGDPPGDAVARHRGKGSMGEVCGGRSTRHLRSDGQSKLPNHRPTTDGPRSRRHSDPRPDAGAAVRVRCSRTMCGSLGSTKALVTSNASHQTDGDSAAWTAKRRYMIDTRNVACLWASPSHGPSWPGRCSATPRCYGLMSPATATSHRPNEIPLIHAGNYDGRVEPGRRLQYDQRAHDDGYLSLLQLFGSSAASFGNPEVDGGPLTNP